MTYIKQVKARFIVPLLIISCLFFSCDKEKHDRKINFYYWKTVVDFGETEKKYFDKLNSKKLYIRLFDVDLEPDGFPTPKAKIKLFDPKELKAEYIPVVFITNRTFTDMKYWNTESLARSINEMIDKIIEKNNIPASNEIQIDCDWTTTSRDDYFLFLKELRMISGKDITCTLRLHQVKDKELAGIPPVDKAYLMCYATTSPNDKNTQNSILDIELLKNYTKDINKYPLNLDIALPLYSWGVVTNHRGEIKLINNVDINSFVPDYFKEIGPNTYEAIDDFFLQGIYLNKGFTLRIERINPELLNEAKDYLDKKMNKQYNIVYYHLDKPFLERFSFEELR